MFTLITTIIYVCLGKLSLAFSSYFSTAFTLYLPAGVALAYCYQFGKKALLPLFLGACIIIFSTHSSAALLKTSLITYTLVSALLFSIQQYAISCVFKKIQNKINKYTTIIIGTISIILISFISPIADTFLSIILNINHYHSLPFTAPPTNLINNVMLLWGSEILGTILAGELFILILTKKNTENKKYVLFSLCYLATLITSIALIAVYERKWEKAESTFQLQLESQRILDDIQAHMNEQEFILNQMNSFFSLKKNVTRRDFKTISSEIIKHVPTIQAIEWAPEVTDKQRKAFETEQQAFEDEFSIKEILNNESTKLVPSRKKATYLPVTYAEPIDTNHSVIGLDLLSAASRKTAVEKTRQTSTPIATAPLRLIQTPSHDFGFLLIRAIQTKSGQKGVFLLTLRVADFVRDYTPRDLDNLQIRVTDTESGKVIMGPEFNQYPQIALRQILFGGRPFEVTTYRNFSSSAIPLSWQSKLALVFSILTSIIFIAFLWLMRSKVKIIESIVNAKTRELEESQNWLHSITYSLGEGVIVTNPDGVIIFSNPESGRILQHRENDIKGLAITTLFHPNEKDADSQKGSLNLISSVIGQGITIKEESEFLTQSGITISVNYSATPLITNGICTGMAMVFSDISERKTMEINLHNYAFHDALTGLFNRRYFISALDTLLKAQQRKPMILFFIDMDGFKQINDTYGHETGDEILIEFAKHLQQSVRQSDVVSRIGGDEFTIIITDVTNPFASAEEIAEKIMEGLQIPVMINGIKINMQASIGIAVYHPDIDHAVNADLLIERADNAMYDAKKYHGHKVAFA